MRRHRERMGLNAEINVVSLIDVMMLLMVIFMITAPMMQGGIDISLPRARGRSWKGWCVSSRRCRRPIWAGRESARGNARERDTGCGIGR